MADTRTILARGHKWEQPQNDMPVDHETKHCCPFCKEVLFHGSLGPGTVIEIKCRRCGAFPVIAVPHPVGVAA